MITHSGQNIDPARMAMKDVMIADVARGLATRYLFRGHSRDLLTYAEHHVILSTKVGDELALRALLCGGAIAYTEPMHTTSPRVQDAVFRAFGVPADVEADRAVREVELRLYAHYASALWEKPVPGYAKYAPLECNPALMPPARAEHVFSKQFCDLYTGWS